MSDLEKFVEKTGEYMVERAWNTGDVDALDEVLPENFVYKAPLGIDLHDLEAFKEHILATRKSYPDIHVTVNENVLDLENKIVVSEWTCEGTNSGDAPFLGFPITGKKISFHGVSLHHIEEDHYADELVYWDTLSVLQQLGLVPEMAA